MSIIGNGKRYGEHKFPTERDFEDDVVSSSKVLFGTSTVYINAKKKIESKSLGGTIPDAFFFDFSDPADTQFYIVEVELSRHRFFEHIFPQVTKFFAFFKNKKQQKALVDKLFAVIDTDNSLKGEFKKYLGQAEIYKFLSDIVDSSQNILLVADGAIAELPEIMDTYTDTWGKMVRYLEVKKYVNGGDTIYSITPDFETLQYTEIVGEPADEQVEEIERPKYSEEYHLDGVSAFSKEIYTRIKNIASSVDKTLVFNPQKHYISIKANKNIAFIKIQNKKVRFIVMMPEEEIRKCIKRYPVASLSAPVQGFYNGSCASVDMSNLDGVDELPTLIHRMIEYNQRH